MGYAFLGIALLAGATKGFFGKKTSGAISGFRDSLIANIIRMSICVIIGFVIPLVSGNTAQILPSWPLLLISALSGISTSIFVVTWLLSVKRSAYMMVDVFLMLGVLVPITLSSILFSESVKLTQYLGMGILIFSALIMASYNNSVKQKLTFVSVILLILCGAANGLTDFSQKLFIQKFPDLSVSVFNFYSYLWSAVTLLICLLFAKKRNSSEPKADFKKLLVYVLAMAVCLFINSYFKTAAAQHLSSVLLYPLNQGASLILSTAMSAFFFGEKPTVKCYIGLAFAFTGLLIINLL